MKLIVGLGNHEPRYEGTRHNVGFFMLDHYAAHHQLTWKRSERFRADITEYSVDGEKIVLAKPRTYYNQVGESIQTIATFYKIPIQDILVVHDDLALPLGTIRTRLGGSDGGNNGLKSLEQHLGQGTARVRIGVWTEHHEQVDKVAVVLGRFNSSEQSILEAERTHATDIIDQFIAGNFETTTHRHEI